MNAVHCPHNLTDIQASTALRPGRRGRVPWGRRTAAQRIDFPNVVDRVIRAWKGGGVGRADQEAMDVHCIGRAGEVDGGLDREGDAVAGLAGDAPVAAVKSPGPP